MRKLLRKFFAVLPVPLKNLIGGLWGCFKISKARRAFDSCATAQKTLPAQQLERLMNEGFRGPDVIRYDPQGLELRAREKVKIIRNRVPLDHLNDCLELGCWDGMVGVELAQLGKRAYGIDLKKEGFDPRAAAAGVQLILGDVDAMPIEDSSMDLIYSFAAFEHFPNPDKVLSESRRVLRRGGYLYLSFGPVYTSPYGLHAYRQIPIPYCHYLFKEEDLKDYARAQGLRVEWPYVNRVTVTGYRDCFARYQNDFDHIFYKEHPTGGVGAELIARYPYCFKGRATLFSDFFVSAIELVWRKK